MTAATATRRQTAAERRETVIAAAAEAFARDGLHGTSTETIAARAGISQPYLFRLFGTKKELFLAVVERNFERILEAFRRTAAEAPAGSELEAMGKTYSREFLTDRFLLLVQMQAYAACVDPDVRAVVRRGFGRVVDLVERIPGTDEKQVRDFLAIGMLLNVVASMHLDSSQADWARRLVAECMQ